MGRSPLSLTLDDDGIGAGGGVRGCVVEGLGDRTKLAGWVGMFAAGLVGPDKGSFADLVGPDGRLDEGLGGPDGGSDVGFGGTVFGLQTAIFPRWLSSISALCGAELIENELKTKRMQPKFRKTSEKMSVHRASL